MSIVRLSASEISWLSTNPHTTDNLLEVLREYHGILENAIGEEGSFVIAGGAVRDAILGYFPNDIDTFFLGLDKENMEDELTYYNYLLRNNESFCAFTRNQNAGNEYFEDLGRGLYDSSSFQASRLYINHRHVGRLDNMADTSRTPEELIGRFDHDLVRCFFDKDGVAVSENFLAALKAGRVASPTQEAQRRLTTWKKRTGHKIVIGRPPLAPAAAPRLNESSLPSGVYRTSHSIRMY